MKRLIIFISLFIPILLVNAQTTDFGGRLGVSYTKDFGTRWDLNLLGDVYMNQNFTKYEKFRAGIGVDYTFFRKKLKVGTTYYYINQFTSSHIYENRHRANVSISYSEKYRQYSFSYRLRLQTTFRDETRDYYRFNPKIYLRNKFQVSYSFYTKPIKLRLSEEFFWRLDRPDQRIIDQLRTTFGVQYRFNSVYAIDFYVRSGNDIQVNDRENIFSLGAILKIKNR